MYLYLLKQQKDDKLQRLLKIIEEAAHEGDAATVLKAVFEIRELYEKNP
jgi:hypothetical protein